MAGARLCERCLQLYSLGLQDRFQRKIPACVTWEGCNAKILRNVDLDLDLDLPE